MNPHTLILAGFVVALVVGYFLSTRDSATAVPVNYMDPTAWEVGPADYPGGNPSQGFKLPYATPDGWALDIPQPTADVGHVHYLRVPCGPLTGKSRITLTFRVEAAPGVVILPRRFPNAPATLSLFLQRRGDDYSGACEAFRWWAATVALLPGVRDYSVSASLAGEWTAVLASSSKRNPGSFALALGNASRVGFTLGGGDGLGHGVYATGPARLVVTSFKVE